MDFSEFFPIPDMMQYKKVLCIQPHQDDTEISAGGAVAKLISMGAEVNYIAVTDGRLGCHDNSYTPTQVAEIRKVEQRVSADVLGVKEIYNLGLWDNTALTVQEIAAKMVPIIREVKPELVITCDPYMQYEVHSDHYKVGLAAAEAFFFSSLARYPYNGDDSIVYDTWQPSAIAFYHSDNPNTYIDITDFWEQKVLSIKKHVSQFDYSDEIFENFMKFVTHRAERFGQVAGCKYAEAYKVLLPRHLHGFEYAWKA